MATSSGDSFEEGLGAYHLISPLACMSLAGFILGLEATINALSDNIFSQAREFVSSPWGWSPEVSRSSLCGNSFIERWRLEVAVAIQLRLVLLLYIWRWIERLLHLSVDFAPDTLFLISANEMTDRPPKTSKTSQPSTCV